MFIIRNKGLERYKLDFHQILTQKENLSLEKYIYELIEGTITSLLLCNYLGKNFAFVLYAEYISPKVKEGKRQ